MIKKIGIIVLSLGIVAILVGVGYPYINKYINNSKETNDSKEKDETNNNGKNTVVDGSIDSCPGCKFMYLSNTDIWTAWNSDGKTPTKITSKLSDSYLDVTKSSGKRYFLGVKLNEENEIINIYGCGIQKEVPFCVEATSDGSKYENNKQVLKKKIWADDFKIEKGSENNMEYEVTYRLPTYELLAVQTYSVGTIRIGNNNYSLCVIGYNGYAYCKEQAIPESEQ